ncbi:uncharacterized protein LOC126894789 isoform X2 [Daktulosphaira vitifoliae]|uniref:uncharacterized protein LOC126894789 isoform X2 n=1 Tax=Daktulosphaira vitifoliae TaxID=58002 RepID=UPI0021A9848D|nr:uncharacterized protein LOC126894789 isoform X2 [Daktulosphaira vitifoliae]
MMLVQRISTLFLFMHIQSIICGYFELVDEFKICLESHDTVHNVYEDPKFTDIFEEKLIVWQRNFADRQKFEDIITAQNHFRSIMTLTICPPENNIENCVTNVESCCNTFVEKILHDSFVENATSKENFRQCLSTLNTIDQNFINVLNVKVFDSSTNNFKTTFEETANTLLGYTVTKFKYLADAKRHHGNVMKDIICEEFQDEMKYDCDILIQQCSDSIVTEKRNVQSLDNTPDDPVERIKQCLVNAESGYGLYDVENQLVYPDVDEELKMWDEKFSEEGTSKYTDRIKKNMKERFCLLLHTLDRNICEYEVIKCCNDFIASYNEE